MEREGRCRGSAMGRKADVGGRSVKLMDRRRGGGPGAEGTARRGSRGREV